ncbi:MAG: winged helix-turn-helix transcriptional regulator [bacterium]|nr:winged helix-turn-helix transcriptional regulator [bacterium]
MLSNNHLKFLQPTPAFRELMILLEIGKNSRISQNGLAQRVGLAPSMVNNYIKDLIQRGIIEIGGQSPRRLNYSLTSKGLDQRAVLLSSYMIETIKLYKNAKAEFKIRLSKLMEEGIKRVIFYGAGETAEVVFPVAEELGFNVVAVVDNDPRKQGQEFAGRIILDPSHIERIRPDGVVITSLGYPYQIYESIKHLEGQGIKVRKL